MSNINTNYGARQPNQSAYIKTFHNGETSSLWKILSYINPTTTQSVQVLTPSYKNIQSVYIPGDLFVDGNIISPSDINLKTNIELLDINVTDKLINLKPSSFVFKDDIHKKIHYGFIANELENEYPELVQYKPDLKYSNLKSVNYLEIIPLLVHKIQLMQKEIDELKLLINK
jgi:hypothetical protein